MTPKEKAQELFCKMYSVKTMYDAHNITIHEAKQCTLIAVENEYNAKIQAYNEMSEYCPDIAGQSVFYANKEREQVKQEIENL